MDVLLLDMASILFKKYDKVLVTLAPTGDLLATSPLLYSDEASTYLALNTVLDEARVVYKGTRLPVALYNPITAEIIIGAVPKGKVFSDSSPIVFPTKGIMVSVNSATICIQDRTIPIAHSSLDSLYNNLLAH